MSEDSTVFVEVILVMGEEVNETKVLINWSFEEITGLAAAAGKAKAKKKEKIKKLFSICIEKTRVNIG